MAGQSSLELYTTAYAALLIAYAALLISNITANITDIYVISGV